MRFFSLPKFRVSDWHMPVGGSDLLGVVDIRANDDLPKLGLKEKGRSILLKATLEPMDPATIS